MADPTFPGDNDRPTVLVTGASSGIGQACAIHLDRIGWRVLAGIRRPEAIEALHAVASARLQPVILDVTDPASIEAAGAAIRDAVGDRGLQGLVNNAGIAVAGIAEFLPMERLREQFEVNFFGQVAVTQTLLPLLRAGNGRVVNMSSISGRHAAPFFSAYAASKHALEAWSDSLRQELAMWGLHVAIIEPGAIDTPIWESGEARARRIVEEMPEAGRSLYAAAVTAGLDTTRRAGRRGIPAQRVAEVVEHALTAPSPRARYVVGRDAWIQAIAKRLLPDAWLDRLTRRAMRLPRIP